MAEKYKQYICVEAVFDTTGCMRPKAIIWTDGIKYSIDKITDIRRAASLKSGGTGMRYTCVLSGLTRQLFFDNGRWYTEKIV